MVHTVDLAEHEKSTKKPETITANIRKPTWEDYQNIPNTYVSGKPILTWDKLKKVSDGIKRLHDRYMRAFVIGMNTMNVSIPPLAFVSGRPMAVVTFEDMWLMLKSRHTAYNSVCIISVTHIKASMCCY